ncbi:MAG: sulfate permease [Deinococcales bacterium]
MFDEIYPDDLSQWLEDGAQLVDVREAWEYGAGHVPGAVNIPLDELIGRIGELREPLVLVPTSGWRAASRCRNRVKRPNGTPPARRRLRARAMSPSPASQPPAGAARPSGLERWLPAWGWLRRYERRDLGGDMTAGIVVAVMLVPQGMAYAMLAGMPPVAGLYASAIPVLAYVLFGSSRQLAVGPSALTALLTLAGVSQLATPGSASFVVLAGALALMAGLFQLLLGVLRAGFITNFLSSAVINGFTSGAAIIIAVNQLKDLLGVKADAGAGLVGLVRGLLPHLHQTNPPTLVIGAGAVALLLVLKRWRVRALPGPLVAVVLGTVAVGLAHLDAAGVAVVGRVPRGLPLPALPAVDLAALPALVPAALTLAFVGFMEAIAVGRSLAARERTTVDANRELIGLGLANLVAGVVRGYPLGGGFGRSAVNYEAGARTQLASVVRAALLVLTLLALTPLFTFLPRAVLGAIVFVAVIGLVDLREPVRLFRVRPADGWTLVVTFAATLFIGVEAGILIGVTFSLLVFVARSAYPHVAELGWLQNDGVFRNVRRFEHARRYRGVLLARPDASLYFANMAFLESWLDDALRRRAADAGEPVQAVVLDCSAVNDVDAVALEALERRLVAWNGAGVALHLAGVKGPVRDALARSGFSRRHPERVAHLSVAHALETLGAEIEAPTGTTASAATPASGADLPGGSGTEDGEPSTEPAETSDPSPSPRPSAGPKRRRAAGGNP